MNVALLILAASLAAETPATTPKAGPMAVQVEPGKGAQGVAEWTRELRIALDARKDEFRLAKPGEPAELVVRLDSLGHAKDGTPTLNGALLLGGVKRSFSYGFTNVPAAAEKLARNLRRLAEQMKTAGK